MTRAWRFVVDHYLLVPIGGALALIWANTYAESYFRLVSASAFAVNEIGMAIGLAYLAQEVVRRRSPAARCIHSAARPFPSSAASAGRSAHRWRTSAISRLATNRSSPADGRFQAPPIS